MKKIFLTIFFCFILVSEINAEEIRFIYLNGANANSEKKQQEFVSEIFNLQRSIKQIFESDKTINSTLLQDGRYKICEIPKLLFWGLFSKQDLAEVNNLLSDRTANRAFPANKIRKYLVNNIHDIVWVIRSKNMEFVTEELHKKVVESHKNGEKVILLGHSAGGFVTYNYLLNKTMGINLQYYIKNSENKYTCKDAITKSGIAKSLQNGDLLINNNAEEVNLYYKNIDTFSKSECIPEGAILGVMNFGSSIELFYPDRLEEPQSAEYYLQKSLLEYLKQNNMFMLNLNYTDDPLSLLSNDFRRDDKAAIYTYMTEKSPSSFFSAHYTYWKYPIKFAKLAKNGYIKGFCRY